MAICHMLAKLWAMIAMLSGYAVMLIVAILYLIIFALRNIELEE